MSAWMITNDHADLIATAYLAFVDPAADAHTIALDMLRENMFSLAARYGTPVDNFELAQYRHNPWPGTIDKMWANKAASCAAYQSCEHEGWKTCITFIRLYALMDATGGRAVKWPDGIPWGIEAKHRPSHRTQMATITHAAQLAQLRVASPLRPPAGRTHDVDGLPMFDHARQPRLL